LELIETHGDDSDDWGSPILGNHLRKPPYTLDNGHETSIYFGYTLDNGHEMNQSWSSFLGFFRFLKAGPFGRSTLQRGVEFSEHHTANAWRKYLLKPSEGDH
jgi:hypothetical protein